MDSEIEITRGQRSASGNETDETMSPAKKPAKKSAKKGKIIKEEGSVDSSWPGHRSHPSILVPWFERQKDSTGKIAFKEYNESHGNTFSHALDGNLKQYRCLIENVGLETFVDWTKTKSPKPLTIADAWNAFPLEWDAAKNAKQFKGKAKASS